MSEKAKAARREYMRKYRNNHKEELNAYARQWRKDNPDKVKASNARYWAKVAEQAEEDTEL